MPHRIKDTLIQELLALAEDPDPEDTLFAQLTRFDAVLVVSALNMMSRHAPPTSDWVVELKQKLTECALEQGFLTVEPEVV